MKTNDTLSQPTGKETVIHLGTLVDLLVRIYSVRPGIEIREDAEDDDVLLLHTIMPGLHNLTNQLAMTIIDCVNQNLLLHLMSILEPLPWATRTLQCSISAYKLAAKIYNTFGMSLYGAIHQKHCEHLVVAALNDLDSLQRRHMVTMASTSGQASTKKRKHGNDTFSSDNITTTAILQPASHATVLAAAGFLRSVLRNPHLTTVGVRLSIERSLLHLLVSNDCSSDLRHLLHDALFQAVLAPGHSQSALVPHLTQIGYTAEFLATSNTRSITANSGELVDLLIHPRLPPILRPKPTHVNDDEVEDKDDVVNVFKYTAGNGVNAMNGEDRPDGADGMGLSSPQDTSPPVLPAIASTPPQTVLTARPLSPIRMDLVSHATTTSANDLFLEGTGRVDENRNDPEDRNPDTDLVEPKNKTAIAVDKERYDMEQEKGDENTNDTDSDTSEIPLIDTGSDTDE